eukprot:scaffold2886_cov398-Prasinococcus_capsulatus_cf.AAC.16
MPAELPLDDRYYTLEYDAELLGTIQSHYDAATLLRGMQEPGPLGGKRPVSCPCCRLEIEDSPKDFAPVGKNAGKSKASRELSALLPDVRPSDKGLSTGQSGAATFTYAELVPALEKVLEECRSMGVVAAPFLRAVKKSEAPDYYDVIKNPMDLGTMGKKLKAGKYQTKEAFSADLQLIARNCRTYNEPKSTLVKYANAVQARGLKVLKGVPEVTLKTAPPNDYSDGVSAVPTTAGTTETVASLPPGSGAISLESKGNGDGLLQSGLGTRSPSTVSLEKGGNAATGAGTVGKSEALSGPESALEKTLNDAVDAEGDELTKLWLRRTQNDRLARLKHSYANSSMPFADKPAIQRTPEGMLDFLRNSSQQDLHSQAVSLATSATSSTVQKGSALKMKAAATRNLFAPELSSLANSLPDCAIPLKYLGNGLGAARRRKRWLQDKRAGIGEVIKSAKDRKRYAEVLQASLSNVQAIKGMHWQLQHAGISGDPVLAPGVHLPLRVRLSQATSVASKSAKKTSKSGKGSGSNSGNQNPPGMSLWGAGSCDRTVDHQMRGSVGHLAAFSGFDAARESALRVLSDAVSQFVTKFGSAMSIFMDRCRVQRPRGEDAAATVIQILAALGCCDGIREPNRVLERLKLYKQLDMCTQSTKLKGGRERLEKFHSDHSKHPGLQKLVAAEAEAAKTLVERSQAICNEYANEQRHQLQAVRQMLRQTHHKTPARAHQIEKYPGVDSQAYATSPQVPSQSRLSPQQAHGSTTRSPSHRQSSPRQRPVPPHQAQRQQGHPSMHQSFPPQTRPGPHPNQQQHHTYQQPYHQNPYPQQQQPPPPHSHYPQQPYLPQQHVVAPPMPPQSDSLSLPVNAFDDLFDDVDLLGMGQANLDQLDQAFGMLPSPPMDMHPSSAGRGQSAMPAAAGGHMPHGIADQRRAQSRGGVGGSRSGTKRKTSNSKSLPAPCVSVVNYIN